MAFDSPATRVSSSRLVFCSLLLLLPGCFLLTSGLTSGGVPESPDGEVVGRDVAPSLRDSDPGLADSRVVDGGEGDAGKDGPSDPKDSESPDVTLPDGGTDTSVATPDAAISSRLVFLTSLPIRADFGGLAAADQLCTTQAGGRAAVAYLETGAIRADSRITVSPTIEYRLPSGLLAFAAGAPISGGPLRPLNEALLPTAGTVVSGFVWVGVAGGTCQDWSQVSGGTTLGTTQSAATWNRQATGYPCVATARLFCFQK